MAKIILRPGVGKGGNPVIKHGHKRTGAVSPEYRTWLGMKRRCSDPTYKDFPNWGGRGIRVCEAWDRSFEAFLSDMGVKPSPEYQIDRMNPNGDYEPSNCRWVTPAQQGSENRRNICPVKIGGLTFSSRAAACRHYGVSTTVVQERLKRGVDLEVAITTPGRLQRPRPKESYRRKDGDYSGYAARFKVGHSN